MVELGVGEDVKLRLVLQLAQHRAQDAEHDALGAAVPAAGAAFGHTFGRGRLVMFAHLHCVRVRMYR